MTIASLVVVVFIFLLAGLITLRPFFDELEAVTGDMEGSERYSLLAEKERLLSAIEELDRDHESRRISGEAHSRERDQLIRQAAEILRRLDALVTSGAAGSDVPADELENYISAGWNGLAGEPARVCEKCASPVAAEDRFCRQCGKEL